MRKLVVVLLVGLLILTSLAYAEPGGKGKGNAYGHEHAFGLTANRIYFNDPEDLEGFMPDRRAPAGFEITSFDDEMVLMQSIDAEEAEAGFYRFAGMKMDVANAKKVSIEVYIPEEWATIGHQTATFWARSVDSEGVEIVYPIIGFSSEDYDNDGILDPGFVFWPSMDDDKGYWSMPYLPEDFAYNEWYELTISIEDGEIIVDTEGFEMNINEVWGEDWIFSAEALTHVFLQGYNAPDGTSYEIYWDNLKYK